MDKDNLLKVADSFINFLWIIQNNVLREHDISKNFYISSSKENNCLCDFSIPPSHVRVILYLLKCNSSPISQIADTLNISKSNMTPIIDNLINYGLVERYSDSNDRRILRVELTQKALDLLDTFRIKLCNTFIENISYLSDDEINTLNDSICNLTSIFKKLNE